MSDLNDSINQTEVSAYDSPIPATRAFLDLLNSIEKDYPAWVDALNTSEKETQDLLHEIELTKFDARRGYLLAKALQDVRQRRRQLKEQMEVARILRDFTNDNKTLKINLFKILSSMERVKEDQGRRYYRPRVRTDMKLGEKIKNERDGRRDEQDNLQEM